MDLNLGGKAVIVTGGAKGMGYQIAKAFLKEGCQVGIVEIDKDSLKKAEVELAALGNCKGWYCDVSDGDQVKSMLAEAEKAFGRIDILVNNAGVLRPKKIEDMEEAEWDFSMNVNLKSAFLCSKYVLPYMKKQNSGVILNAASFSALISSIGHGAYSAAKTAVTNLTKTCAAEFAPYNIRVLSYIPGVIATHLTEKMRSDPDKSKKMLGDIPLNRFGEPSEVAAVVTFLASDQAGYMTGSAVEIHGGKLCVQDPAAARE